MFQMETQKFNWLLSHTFITWLNHKVASAVLKIEIHIDLVVEIYSRNSCSENTAQQQSVRLNICRLLFISTITHTA